MTPLDDVFMLRSDAILDYDTMKKIADTGHSRVPVYEEVEVPILGGSGSGVTDGTKTGKKIIGVLMVKQVRERVGHVFFVTNEFRHTSVPHA